MESLVSERFFFIDIVCLFFLSMNLAFRGRLIGEGAVGSFLAAFFSALTWPIARELFLTGSVITFFSTSGLLLAVFLGALLGTFALFLRIPEHFFPLLSLLSLSLLTTFSLLCALTRLSPVGALVMAFFLAALPECISDFALGDMARLVTEGWRNMRALFGAICALFVFLSLPFLPQIPLPPDCLMLGTGVFLPLLLQWKSPL
ncbi:MAG: hypothetical protein K5657_05005 [Desulfovibrio sp.]|nr:hypothetical protein [Desulfovibrio sp.]